MGGKPAMSVEPERRPRFVQRVLRARDWEDQAGIGAVDRMFRFDYMGSAEFEFGTIPKAWKMVKASIAEAEKCVPIHAEGVVLYYVGPSDRESLDQACLFVSDQIKDSPHRTLRLQEGSRMRSALIEKSEYLGDLVGWWYVDSAVRHESDGKSWALFTSKEAAREWVRCAERK